MVKLTGSIKTKSRSKPTLSVVVEPAQVYNNLNQPQGSPFGGGSVTVRESWEKIAYTSKKVSQRHLSNVCDHQNFTRYYSDPTPTRWKVRHLSPHHADGWYVMYGNGHQVGTQALAETAAFTALGTDNNLFYPGSPQDDLDANLYKLRPDLTELQLPNFLLELDDIQKLWPQLKRNMALWRSISRKARVSSHINVRTAKVLAGDHLAYSFGVKPLFGDLQIIREILLRLIAKLNDFNARLNLYSSNKLTIENTLLNKTGTILQSGNPQFPIPWYAVMTRKKEVGLTYRALPKSVTAGYLGMLEALLDALGFELNPRILWDAIPFTFVLDWFFDVGSWMERHKHDTLELPIVYVDSFVQCTQDLTISSHYVQNKDDLITDFGRRTWPAWVYHKKRFMRFPVRPSETAFAGLGWRLPTLNQAKLFVSLGTVLK
jgi:hypothetical protein